MTYVVDHRQRMLEILLSNQGFDDPERWIDFGIAHCFKHVPAEKLLKCPDCDAPFSEEIGQFVYYSTLVKLRLCTRCGLAFTNTRIDPLVIQSHFENAYKNEDYFLNRRRSIFNQIVDLVDQVAPKGGRVIDVGGAKGHLLAMLKERRPDLSLVLNDLSQAACAFASSRYDLETVCGDIHEIDRMHSPFDVVIMSDMLYYEPQLNMLWRVLPRIFSGNGAVIIRIPNKYALILFSQFIIKSTSPRKNRAMQSRIKLFNPEHLYLFSRRYIETRLNKIGFLKVKTLPSKLLVHNRWDLRQLFYYIANAVSFLSNSKFIISPSAVVIATNLLPADTTKDHS